MHVHAARSSLWWKVECISALRFSPCEWVPGRMAVSLTQICICLSLCVCAAVSVCQTSRLCFPRCLGTFCAPALSLRCATSLPLRSSRTWNRCGGGVGFGANKFLARRNSGHLALCMTDKPSREDDRSSSGRGADDKRKQEAVDRKWRRIGDELFQAVKEGDLKKVQSLCENGELNEFQNVAYRGASFYQSETFSVSSRKQCDHVFTIHEHTCACPFLFCHSPVHLTVCPCVLSGLSTLADSQGVRAPAEYADEFGVSCVHLAAKRGDVAMVNALVSFGADWQVVTRCTAPCPIRFAAREYILRPTAWFL